MDMGIESTNVKELIVGRLLRDRTFRHLFERDSTKAIRLLAPHIALSDYKEIIEIVEASNILGCDQNGLVGGLDGCIEA